MSNKRVFDNFIDQVKLGMEGGNKWIPLGLPSIDEHIGLGKKMYYLIGGEPGTGKTALVDQLFVLSPYEWFMLNKDQTDKKLRIIYRSMERSSEHKIAKWVCRRLWLKHRILVDVPTIFGWGYDKNKIPEEVYEKIIECREYFEKMFDIVHITDGAINPTGVYNQCKRISYAEGTLIKSNNKVIKAFNKKYPDGKVIKEFSGDHFDPTVSGNKYYEPLRNVPGKEEQVKIYQYHTEYFPEDPDRINVVIADHIAKFKPERGFSQKQTVDKASEYFGELRDIYGWSPVAVSQFNRNIANTTRRTKLDLAPEKQDFKHSGNMYEDADFAAGLFSPHESGLSEFKEYPIPQFKNEAGFNRFRSLHILKNTYGMDILVKAMTLLGECGHFYELPPPSQLIESDIYHRVNPCQHPELKDKAKKLI